MQKIIGPFSQIITLRKLNLRGALKDEDLEILQNQAVLIENGLIKNFGKFDDLKKENPNAEIELITSPSTLLPAFIDCHTHICFAGTRSLDYQMRMQGKSYLEIAQNGGGINSSVNAVRQTSLETLADLTASRAQRCLREGVATIEVKSGYGLDAENELKMLKAIKLAQSKTAATLVPTCLAAHIKPRDFLGSNKEYLQYILDELLPIIKAENLAKRIDIFVEKTAFNEDEARFYLSEAQKMGFEITVHADQFTPSGSRLAVEFNAFSADHLEVSGDVEINLLAKSNVVCVALPNASYGLGIYEMTPARKLLDAGAILAIASDWNPGSAPMGDLLCGAALFSMKEKLSSAETFAALTFRAAKALNLENHGRLQENFIANMQAYECNDFREILYHQGKLKPSLIWKNGKKVN
jgi:imidazolonepropionase